jgi:hypothetical protein
VLSYADMFDGVGLQVFAVVQIHGTMTASTSCPPAARSNKEPANWLCLGDAVLFLTRSRIRNKDMAFDDSFDVAVARSRLPRGGVRC